ncbi:fructose-1,6-bisphosphatase [Paraburkholderia sp. EG286B]|uniref:fructose-1,6-bisphosphatase n=1 Tax=Paraburkholderia sp. EG286B TaxID=3237011 RepID=UPI0034D18575
MQSTHVTLDNFLAGELQGKRDATAAGSLRILLGEIAQAVRLIASMIEQAAPGRGAHDGGAQATLDVAAREVLAALCERSACVAGYAAAGTGAVRATAAAARGGYLLAFDALDSAAQLMENGLAGSIFSVREALGPVMDGCALPGEGHVQCAAGYVIYGASTLLVLTLGRGTHGFTLERESGAFVLTHRAIRVPEEGGELSVDGARECRWAPPVLRYVRECREGSMGVRERNFSQRFSGCAPADVHRVLMRGGVGIVPCEQGEGQRADGLRLVHVAQPLAWIVEQAGGAASTGVERVLDLHRCAIDDYVPAMLGSKSEVGRLERYHREYERGVDRPFVSPLFNERSLFRPEACA